MQKFYIHKDDQPHGPFSVAELRTERISRETMVWFEGAEDWKKAVEVSELSEIFKSVPPPLQGKTETNPPPFQEKSTVTGNVSQSGKKTSKFNMWFLIAGILIVGLIIFSIYSSQKVDHEIIEDQLRNQDMVLQDQQEKIQQQEQLEQQRIEEENERQIQANEANRKAELEALRYQHDEAVVALRSARLRLEEIQKFQLLRTASEKQQQVERQLENIVSWESEVSRLQNEINRY